MWDNICNIIVPLISWSGVWCLRDCRPHWIRGHPRAARRWQGRCPHVLGVRGEDLGGPQTGTNQEGLAVSNFQLESLKHLPHRNRVYPAAKFLYPWIKIGAVTYCWHSWLIFTINFFKNIPARFNCDFLPSSTSLGLNASPSCCEHFSSRPCCKYLLYGDHFQS